MFGVDISTMYELWYASDVAGYDRRRAELPNAPLNLANIYDIDI